MALTPPLASAALSRRALLGASAAGLAALLVGCTTGDDDKAPVTTQQADALADQVVAQRSLVAAFSAATAADPALGQALTDLGPQLQDQLDRLEKAAPGTPSGSSAPPAPAGDAKAWLRDQVTATADSHAAACLDQTGPRAALLGSIAAGLRGMDGVLA